MADPKTDDADVGSNESSEGSQCGTLADTISGTEQAGTCSAPHRHTSDARQSGVHRRHAVHVDVKNERCDGRADREHPADGLHFGPIRMQPKRCREVAPSHPELVAMSPAVTAENGDVGASKCVQIRRDQRDKEDFLPRLKR
eukprot:2050308-Prymnesium_polylepis.2